MTVCAGEFSVKYKFLSKYIYYQLKTKQKKTEDSGNWVN